MTPKMLLPSTSTQQRLTPGWFENELTDVFCCLYVKGRQGQTGKNFYEHIIYHSIGNFMLNKSSKRTHVWKRWKKVMGHTRSFFTGWRQILDVFSRFLDQKRVSYRNSYKKFCPSDLRAYPSYFFFKLTLLTISVKKFRVPEHGHGLPGILPYYLF